MFSAPKQGAHCQIDVVVIVAGERTGIAGWLPGSSAEQMLKVVPCGHNH